MKLGTDFMVTVNRCMPIFIGHISCTLIIMIIVYIIAFWKNRQIYCCELNSVNQLWLYPLRVDADLSMGLIDPVTFVYTNRDIVHSRAFLAGK